MHFQQTYKLRLAVAKWVFAGMLLLLVNGWLDAAVHHPCNRFGTVAMHLTADDDIDSMYEWLAEDVLEIEDAAPESGQEEEDEGCMAKITLHFAGFSGFCETALPPPHKSYPCMKQAVVARALCIWVPPPNGACFV